MNSTITPETGYLRLSPAFAPLLDVPPPSLSGVAFFRAGAHQTPAHCGALLPSLSIYQTITCEFRRTTYPAIPSPHTGLLAKLRGLRFPCFWPSRLLPLATCYTHDLASLHPPPPV